MREREREKEIERESKKTRIPLMCALRLPSVCREAFVVTYLLALHEDTLAHRCAI